MSTIRILSEKVASQIAAGEVIDRPASVVRELIDNSLDAGADRIVVKIDKGGKALIKVSDNGVGMSRDDLLLCVERHATSKIETASDLFSVKSFGFRGEALPSIAAVSRTEITSRPYEQLAGYRLKIAGGRLIDIQETGTPAGTIVEVRNLFYNIPARRKFLRTARTETDYIIDVLSRAALPFPTISFKLEDGGKSIMHLPASDQQIQRLSSLMGQKVAESVIEIQDRNSEMLLTAYLGPPHLNRARGDRLFVYVNRRNIRDRLVNKALLEGYGQRLMKGQYPQAVVFIETDPSKVDVNVHPTKQEVRFHNSSAVYRTVISSIEKALNRSSHHYFSIGPRREEERSYQRESLNLISEPGWRYSPTAQSQTIPTAAATVAEQSTLADSPQIIGQLGNTYILCQVRDGLLMVDQHAAHERVVYDSLKRGFTSSRIEGQTLLVPHKLEMSTKEQRILLEKGSQLNRFKIELEHFGGNTFLLRSVPAILGSVAWDSFLSELITELENDQLEEDILIDKVLKLMACHGAIRAGHAMSQEEINHLLRQLEGAEIPTNCPHGRPIFKHFTYYEIEKMFKRVV